MTDKIVTVDVLTRGDIARRDADRADTESPRDEPTRGRRGVDKHRAALRFDAYAHRA